MIMNVINELISAVTKIINSLNIMPITDDVSFFGIVIWSIYISIILYFMKKLLEVVL